MIQLLADVNIEGHVTRLVSLMQSDFWREVWAALDIRACRIQDVGLSPDDTDAHVWLICQQKQCYLLTNNRNDDGPDSLEATIWGLQHGIQLAGFHPCRIRSGSFRARTTRSA